ncbi:MAG: MBL fold metallo-hydrolase [Bdellovibrionia bacterium]
MTTLVKSLSDILISKENLPPAQWQLRIVSSGDCQSYIAWNQSTLEALAIDPKLEDLDAYLKIKTEIQNYRWLGVVDTHTHADHISTAAHLASVLSAPVFMQNLSTTIRVDFRIAKTSSLSSTAGPVRFIMTPGHTPDAMCVAWGPFCFTGDTVLYNDCGRDDLPGGDPTAHYHSLQALKKELKPEILMCPGHDFKGGRISSWGAQLQTNSSLTQDEKSFVEESVAFDAPAPALLKKSLFENLK